MHIPLASIVPLLHCCGFATLATRARDATAAVAGYPFPTLVPFAPDTQHRPVILVSGLAEHARNLAEDPRAGFLVFDPNDPAAANGPRVTLAGRFEPVPAAAHAPRYLRYHPDAERYLALGDFSFLRLTVEAMRYIGGFGAMGWVEGAALNAIAPVDEALEFEIIGAFSDILPAGDRIAGVDRLGVDMVRHGARLRCPFEESPRDDAALRAAVGAALAGA